MTREKEEGRGRAEITRLTKMASQDAFREAYIRQAEEITTTIKTCGMGSWLAGWLAGCWCGLVDLTLSVDTFPKYVLIYGSREHAGGPVALCLLVVNFGQLVDSLLVVLLFL